MHFLRSAALGARLLAAFGLMIVIAVVIGATGLLGARTLHAKMDSIGAVDLPSQRAGVFMKP